MRFPNLFVACFAWAALTVSASAQDKTPRFGLVIGNSSYAEPDTALSGVSADARQLADELRKNNFEIDLKENASGSEMRRAIDALMGKLKNGATALLYFGGYGIQVGGQTYLVPADARITSEAGVRDDGISLDATLAEMHRRGAKVKIVIIDAARRNSFETRFRPIPAGVAAVSPPQGTLAIYSAALGKVVTGAHSSPSLFMRELLKELRIANRSLEDSLSNVRNAVQRATNYEQVPWVTTSLFDQFFLVPEAPAAGKAPTAATTTTSPVTTNTPAATTTTIPSTTATNTPATTTAKTAPATPPPATQSKSATAPATAPATTPAPATTTTVPATPSQPAKVEGSDDPAILDLDKKIKVNPNDLAAYYKRGQLYAQYGSFRQAIQDFDAVIRLDSKDAEALNNRCWARAIVGDLQAALGDCDAAIQIRPRYVDAFDSRGFVNLKLNKPKEAIADYDSALRVNPKHPSALYGRGLAKQRSGVTGGNSDIALAKQIQPDIVEEFAKYGIR